MRFISFLSSLLLVLIVSSNLFAQHALRIEITNPQDVPRVTEKNDGTLSITFSEPQVQQVFDNYTVGAFQKEFPMFPEEPGLKDIFYVECNSDQLFADLQSLNYFPQVEVFEKPIELATPSDYNNNGAFNHINVPGAWAITEGSPSIKVGVVDASIPFPVTDPAFADLVDQAEYIHPNSFIGAYTNHGVTVSRIAAATPNNGISGAGVGYNNRLYFGSMQGAAWTTLIQDFVARGARVINMSFTTGCNYNATTQLFMTKLSEKGIILVAAAGNGDLEAAARIFDNGSGPYCVVTGRTAECNPNYTGNANGYLFPASYDNVISVSGTYFVPSDNLYQPLNLSATCTPPTPNVTGINGTLTLNDRVDVICPAGASVATSFAAPMVSGVVSLMLSVNPKLDVNEVIDIFNQTGIDIRNTGTNPNPTTGPYPGGTNNYYFQNGTTNQYKLEDDVRRVDAQAAVQEALNRYNTLVSTVNPTLYSKVTTGAHTNDEANSFGIQWVDYDNDNDLDIFDGHNNLSPQYPNYQFFMFENLCMGASDFADITLPGFDPNNGQQVILIGWGDVDNDGDKDYLGSTDNGEVFLYTNDGGNAFISSLVASGFASQPLRGSRIADFDNDGNLDFVTSHRFGSVVNDFFVFSGNGDGTFNQINGTSDLYTATHGSYGISAGDINGDGNIDLTTTGFGGGGAHIFLGDGNFGFTEVALDPFPYNFIGAYGGNIIDYDNDGDLDVYFFGYPRSLLLNNLGTGKFLYVTDQPIVTDANVPNGYATWGDYDNDGDLDLYAPSLQNKWLYLNCDGITFIKANSEITNAPSETDHETASTAFGDADGDGDLDLYVNNFFNSDFNNYFYENNGNGNSWITLKMKGDPANYTGVNGKTSVSAEGTKIRATITDYIPNPDIRCRQMRHLQTNEGIPHDVYFGFGNYTGLVNFEIEWPSGLVEYVNGVPVNQCYKITENQGIVAIGCPCTQDIPSGTEISGTVGFDQDEDCDCDDDNNTVVDYALDNFWVQITEDLGGMGGTGNAYYTQTQSTGDYSMLVPDGNYIITPFFGGTAFEVSDDCGGNPNLLPPSNYLVTLPPASLDNDFCLKSANCDVSITLYPTYQVPASAPCPSVQQEYCMTIVNNGTTIINPVFTLDLDNNVIINSTSSTCGSVTTNANNELIVNPPTSFGPGQTCTICATVTVNPGTLGSTLITSGSVNGNCQETAQMTEFVNCAYDPNDKLLVNPQSCGPENNIGIDELLVYRIRFQNEGNAPAVNVVITDELDTDLDLGSFQLLNSSHQVTNVSVLPGNKLVFEMNNIQLPSMDVDEPGSKGFILFGIKAKPGVPEGTIVDNVASIYFDLNEAVVTNSVMNTLRAYPQPDVQFEWGRNCTALDISYDFSYTGATPDGATYMWNFGPNAFPSTSMDANPTGISFANAGTEQVSLTVFRYGCEETLTMDVEVASPEGCNGNPNKIALCKDGQTICVSLNAAAALITTGNFCVGDCDETMSRAGSEGVKQPLTDPNVAVFKVSDTEEFEVEVTKAKPLSYRLVSVTGQLIDEREVNEQTFNVNLSGQKRGVYLLFLQTDEGMVIRKLQR